MGANATFYLLEGDYRFLGQGGSTGVPRQATVEDWKVIGFRVQGKFYRGCIGNIGVIWGLYRDLKVFLGDI